MACLRLGSGASMVTGIGCDRGGQHVDGNAGDRGGFGNELGGTGCIGWWYEQGAKVRAEQLWVQGLAKAFSWANDAV
jgi:hypothetical protein